MGFLGFKDSLRDLALPVDGRLAALAEKYRWLVFLVNLFDGFLERLTNGCKDHLATKRKQPLLLGDSHVTLILLIVFEASSGGPSSPHVLVLGQGKERVLAEVGPPRLVLFLIILSFLLTLIPQARLLEETRRRSGFGGRCRGSRDCRSSIFFLLLLFLRLFLLWLIFTFLRSDLSEERSIGLCELFERRRDLFGKVTDLLRIILSEFVNLVAIIDKLDALWLTLGKLAGFEIKVVATAHFEFHVTDILTINFDVEAGRFGLPSQLFLQLFHFLLRLLHLMVVLCFDEEALRLSLLLQGLGDARHLAPRLLQVLNHLSFVGALRAERALLALLALAFGALLVQIFAVVLTTVCIPLSLQLVDSVMRFDALRGLAQTLLVKGGSERIHKLVSLLLGINHSLSFDLGAELGELRLT